MMKLVFVLCLGGTLGDVTYSKETYVLNTDLPNQWNPGPTMNLGRRGHGCGKIKASNQVCIFHNSSHNFNFDKNNVLNTIGTPIKCKFMNLIYFKYFSSLRATPMLSWWQEERTWRHKGI